MEYKLYRLEFPNGVHFGKNSLENAQITLRDDTLFSSLYLEALRYGRADELLESAGNGRLKLSDAFPFKGGQYFLPKPMMWSKARRNQGDSGIGNHKKWESGLSDKLGIMDSEPEGRTIKKRP